MRLHDAALRAAAALAAIAIVACSSLPEIESKKVDYKSQSGRLPPLELPPDLSRPGTDDRYAVPDINPKATATYSDYNRERTDRKSTRLNSSHIQKSRMPSSA